MEKKGGVLVVDDDRVIQTIFKDMLELEGYVVESALDIAEAQKALSRKLFDVLLVDVVLPRISGLALLKTVKERAIDIPIIVMTSQPTIENVTEALRQGAYDYITKPISREVLLRAIEKAVEKKRLTDAKRKLEQEKEVVNRINTLLASKLNIQEVFQEIGAELRKVIEFDRMSVTLFNEKKDKFELFAVAQTGHFENLQEGPLELEDKSVLARVLDTGEVLVIENARISPFSINENLMKAGILSGLSFPLKYQGRILGAINLGSKKPRNFSEKHLQLLTQIAPQLAISIENSRLYKKIKQELEEMKALYETALDMTQQLDMEVLLHTIVKRATDLLEGTSGAIFLYDSDKEELTLVASYNLPTELEKVKLKRGESMVGKVVETGEPVIIDDYKIWEEAEKVISLSPLITTAMEVPLVYRGRIIGVLVVHNKSGGEHFNEADLQLLTFFANQAAIAIENAGLYERERNLSKQLNQKVEERTRTLFALYEASKAINAASTLQEALNMVLKFLSDLIPYDMGEIYLIDEKNDKVSLISSLKSYYQTSKYPEFQTPVDYTSYIVENRQPLIIPDTLFPTGKTPTLPVYLLLRSYIGVPIISKDEKLVGILALGSSKPGIFSEENKRVLSYMADHIVIAVQNAQLLEEIIQSKRLSTLGEMASVVAHEIRNPLLRIRLWVDQLQRGICTEDPTYGLLDNLLKEINGINRLVADILDYAKPIKLNKLPLDITTILEDALADFGEDLLQKKIKIYKKYDSHGIRVALDGMRMKQVFVNLLKNSIEAMEQGGSLTLKVRFLQSEQGHTHYLKPKFIEVSCRDTGCGMTVETLKRVFDPFFTTKEKGSGLGMAIVKRLVELHHGEIEVKSQEGVGTEFIIRLPIKEQSAISYQPSVSR